MILTIRKDKIMMQKKRESIEPKVTVKITYVSNPDPGQMATWRRLWDMLLAGVPIDTSKSTLEEQNNTKNRWTTADEQESLPDAN